MSSSVMRARTRMWRTKVAIILGGNLCGAMWQRPQFVRKRFSPSTRMAAFCAALDVTTFAEGAALVSVDLLPDALLPDAAASIAARMKTTARIRTTITSLIGISSLLGRGETRSDK